MTLNGGLGDVLFDPVLFYNSPTTKISEKLAVTKHCNGKDFWLVTTEVYFYGDSVDQDPIKYSGQNIKEPYLLSLSRNIFSISLSGTV